ncbi:P22 phage major capsid protein family protein [Corynebacterium sphenisci]|uniref:P22 phage major capsid protein family protein n=1 Tax=Corynebacterium sphenisci TaxID=191493 RepID=UPI0009513A53|nr:P22 phage major capsid protein family protein [Corynebacterium sphenisci]
MTDHLLYTPEEAARSTLAALRFQSTLARMVNTDYSQEFIAGRGASVTVKRPIMLDKARTYTEADRAAETKITYSDLYEPHTAVKISDQIYQAVKLPDDFATFTLTSLEQQVIGPMAQSVAEGVNTAVAAAIQSTPDGLTPIDKAARGTYVGANGTAYDTIAELRAADTEMAGFGVGATVKPKALAPKNREEVLGAIRAAYQLLSQRGVPAAGRVLVVGADFEEVLLSLDNLNKVNEAGSDGVLRQATLGVLYGFTVIADYTIDPSTAFAMQRDAITLVTRTTATPRGAAFASTVAADGFAMRYLQDYDPDYLQDRAVVDLFAGASILDGQRIVKIKGAATMTEPAAAGGGGTP